MTKQEAMTLIEKVCAAYRGTLQDHQQIQAALQTIKDEVAEKKK